MVLRNTSTFVVNSFHNVDGFVAASSTSPNMSFNDIRSESPADEYVHTPGSGGADLTFSPWLFDTSPFATPLSRSASLSGSEYVPTPPPYVEDSPPYYGLTSLSQPSVPDYITSFVHNSGHSWPQQFSEFESCVSHQYQPIWNTGLPPSSTEYYAHPVRSNETSPFHQASVPYATYRPSCEPAPCRIMDTDSSISSSSSSSSSESDNDDSEYEDDGSSSKGATRSSSTSKPRGHPAISVMKLGKWSMTVDPLMHPEARLYVCNKFKENDPKARRCETRFVRPEHLRRHLKTVHGVSRDYPCKVPMCLKKFSRGDNLRDHYWSHIQRGGRAGRNEKMSLEELKIILGPKEKELAKKLKHKLINQKRRQREKVSGMRTPALSV